MAFEVCLLVLVSYTGMVCDTSTVLRRQCNIPNVQCFMKPPIHTVHCLRAQFCSNEYRWIETEMAGYPRTVTITAPGTGELHLGGRAFYPALLSFSEFSSDLSGRRLDVVLQGRTDTSGYICVMDHICFIHNEYPKNAEITESTLITTRIFYSLTLASSW